MCVGCSLFHASILFLHNRLWKSVNRRNMTEYHRAALNHRFHKRGGSDCSLTFIMCIVVLVNNNHNNNNISYNYISVRLHSETRVVRCCFSIPFFNWASFHLSCCVHNVVAHCMCDCCKHLKVSFLYEMNLSKFYLWHCHSWRAPGERVILKWIRFLYSTPYIHTYNFGIESILL